MQHESQRGEIPVPESRSQLLGAIRVLDRLIDGAAVETRSDECKFQVSALDAIGLVRHQSDGSLEPPVPKGGLRPVRVFKGETQRDVRGAPRISLRGVRPVGALERVEAFVGVGTPPCRLGETRPVLPRQLFVVAERNVRLVGVLPRMIFEGLAGVLTDLGLGHGHLAGIMARRVRGLVPRRGGPDGRHGAPLRAAGRGAPGAAEKARADVLRMS